MRHFYRSHLEPAAAIAAADRFFPELGLTATASATRSRTFSGPLGALRIAARAEGGHYTFIQVETDQMGESRLDRNVKRFFVTIHREQDPRHLLEAAY
ncbi:MAG TPA: hypothetical protein VMV51_08125 [Gemmatimonadaceae bacterium]|nr:hypothetical protein [Gemmatimonadaceae bacterium]